MTSLFTQCVSFEKAKRLWDILLLEGPFGVVKISLGILKLFEEELSEKSAKEVYPFLKHLPERMNIDKLAASVGLPARCEARSNPSRWRRSTGISSSSA